MTRLRCKPGTAFAGFSPALLRILQALDETARQGVPGAPFAITITAGSNGTHAPGSAHYRLEAVDVRSKDFTPEAKAPFLDALRDRLGPAFFVDLEHLDEPNEHFHVQLRKGAAFP